MKMARSRGQTILKISPEPTFSMTCQVCNVIDSINCCDLCNRMMCTRDTVYVNKKTFCKLCLNDPISTQFVIVQYLDENKPTLSRIIKNFIIYTFSFEWIHKIKLSRVNFTEG